jgi:hypothetical protein
MATPFVAGYASFVGAYLRTTNPDEIKKAIDSHASLNVVTNAKSANNNLPYDDWKKINEKYVETLRFLK